MKDMKKRMKIFGLMMLVSMTMNLMAAPVAGPWFPKLKVKYVFYSAFRTHKSFCESGFGLCFHGGLEPVAENIPQKEGFVPVAIGINDDLSKLFLVVDSKAIEKFENGRYLNQFRNRGEVVFDEDIYLPPDVFSCLGISENIRLQNRYPMKKLDGEYVIEVLLK
jgi:hypothetical protein